MSEIDEKQIERRFEAISQLEPDSELIARDIERVRDNLTEKMNTTQPAKQKMWRIIMKSRITKLAAAAAIVAAVLLSVFKIGVEDTYAIEQTIEAMRKVTTAHCLGKTFTAGRMEMWVKVNPQTGENEKFYLETPEITIVADQNETYMYDRKTNVVDHLKGPGHIGSDVRFGRFIEDVLNLAESEENAEIKINKIDGEKPAIVLTIETDKATLESRVDSVTKLPLSLSMKPKGKPQPGNIGQSIDEIYYNEPLPEGIFEFVVPQGAKVVEQ